MIQYNENKPQLFYLIRVVLIFFYKITYLTLGLRKLTKCLSNIYRHLYIFFFLNKYQTSECNIYKILDLK